MADIAIVGNDVLAMPGSIQTSGICGGVANAGDVMYQSPDDGQWRRAANNSATNGARIPSGIALNGAATGQPLALLTDGNLTVTAVLNSGTAYYLSVNLGKMCPRTDLVAGMDVCLVGIAKTTTVLTVDFVVPGVTL
jgi:hypothetical protein